MWVQEGLLLLVQHIKGLPLDGRATNIQKGYQYTEKRTVGKVCLCVIGFFRADRSLDHRKKRIICR